MSDFFSAAGSIAAAALNANAMKQATAMQLDALNQQRAFTFANLDPSVIGPQASQADVNNAINRLALQGQIDPALLNIRYGSEDSIKNQLDQLQGGGAGGAVSSTASREAISGTPGMENAKNSLVQAAQKELDAGATLPPDVQAELVKAGLEKTGMVTQSGISPQGTGGQILRTILGSAGVALQNQRQQQATGLLTAAQGLENSRQNILQNLFPKLSAVQLSNLGATQSGLQQSNSMLPGGGLSGTDVANIWLARVGATNQLSQNAANVAAQGTLGQAQNWGNLLGSQSGNIGNGLQSGWNSLSNLFGPSGGGAGGGGGFTWVGGEPLDLGTP
jgi:hypothetical protein